MSAAYDLARAAAYWGSTRHDHAEELAAVLSLGEPHHVNEAYDVWETGLLEDAIAEARAGGRMARALDVGAGVGRVAMRLAPYVGRLACVDLAAGMLTRLRRNTADAGLTNIDPLRLRSDRLPFRSGSFDAAVCLGVLEHLPPEVRRATIGEVARVVRSGGFLAVVLNNDESRLLRDPADNPHRVGAQRENGYYCAVVRRDELLAEAARDFEPQVLGSNLFYSLQRHASRSLDDPSRRDARLRPFFARAAAWDRALRPLGPLAAAAADHQFHLWRRR